jgi:hypothetical protein
MQGADSLHALCLALGLVRNLLAGFVQDGGRLILPGTGGEDFPLRAYFTELPATFNGPAV